MVLQSQKSRYDLFFKQNSLHGSLDLLHPEIIQSHIFVCHAKYFIEENPELSRGKKNLQDSAISFLQRISAKAFGASQNAHLLIATSKPFNPRTPAKSAKDFSLLSPSELPSHWNLNTVLIYTAADTKEIDCSTIIHIQSLNNRDSNKQIWELEDGSFVVLEFEFFTHSNMMTTAIKKAQAFDDEISRCRKYEINSSSEKYQWILSTEVDTTQQGEVGLKRQVLADLNEAIEDSEHPTKASEFIKLAKKAQNRLEEVYWLDARCSTLSKPFDRSIPTSSRLTYKSTI
jgi:hypothetical protein